MSEETPPVAVVTGANRGIGRETARRLAELGYVVVATARTDEAAGETAADLLAETGGDVHGFALEVRDPARIAALRNYLVAGWGGVDVLVNNAGVYPDEAIPGLEVPVEMVRDTLEVNALAPLALCQALASLMVTRGRGRIVNVSSGYGQIVDMGGGSLLAYRISKLCLNGITRVLADELRSRGVLVNAVCPGWVRTEMGGAYADRSVEEGAEGVVWAATLPQDGPTGGFFRDGEAIAW